MGGGTSQLCSSQFPVGTSHSSTLFDSVISYYLSKECLNVLKWTPFVPTKWSSIMATMTQSRSNSNSVPREIGWQPCCLRQGFDWIQFRVTSPCWKKTTQFSQIDILSGLEGNTGVCFTPSRKIAEFSTWKKALVIKFSIIVWSMRKLRSWEVNSLIQCLGNSWPRLLHPASLHRGVF